MEIINNVTSSIPCDIIENTNKIPNLPSNHFAMINDKPDYVSFMRYKLYADPLKWPATYVFECDSDLNEHLQDKTKYLYVPKGVHIMKTPTRVFKRINCSPRNNTQIFKQCMAIMTIPENAIVVSDINSQKIRTNGVIPYAIMCKDQTGINENLTPDDTCHSNSNFEFKYKINQLSSSRLDLDPTEINGEGIHAFPEIKHAIDYQPRMFSKFYLDMVSVSEKNA
jgi:hypothetical protein